MSSKAGGSKAAGGKGRNEPRVLTKNSKAKFNYEIDETFEAGIELVGSEVKSVRDGRTVLTDAFAEVRGGQIYLINCNIAVYPFAHARNHEPLRARRLLMHKREILRLQVKIREKGYTLVPITLYSKQGRIKVELGLGRGRKHYDKRSVEREKTDRRELREVLR